MYKGSIFIFALVCCRPSTVSSYLWNCEYGSFATRKWEYLQNGKVMLHRYFTSGWD